MLTIMVILGLIRMLFEQHAEERRNLTPEEHEDFW